MGAGLLKAASPNSYKELVSVLLDTIVPLSCIPNTDSCTTIKRLTGGAPTCGAAFYSAEIDVMDDIGSMPMQGAAWCEWTETASEGLRAGQISNILPQ